MPPIPRGAGILDARVIETDGGTIGLIRVAGEHQLEIKLSNPAGFRAFARMQEVDGAYYSTQCPIGLGVSVKNNDSLRVSSIIIPSNPPFRVFLADGIAIERGQPVLVRFDDLACIVERKRGTGELLAARAVRDKN